MQPMPEARPLPEGALPNPAKPSREEEMAKLGRRQSDMEAEGAMRYAMERNPYPNNRQGRRRWARELAKRAS